MRNLLLLAAFLWSSAALWGEGDGPTPQVKGYVTATQDAGAFDVEGVAVRLTPATAVMLHSGSKAVRVPIGRVYLGETMDVYGKLDKKKNEIAASHIELVEAEPATVHGTAIVDLAPAVGAGVGEHVVRADGYLLHLTAAGKVFWTAPLKSLDDLAANLWVTYRGVQQVDGTVLVETATFSANTVKHTEDRLREKSEYDPQAVDADSKQGVVSRAVLGVDPKKIPPFGDATMQARVTRIGQSLIPAFQRALPESDPTKIDFRFEVIDHSSPHDAWSLPSGIILVPHQVVQRLANDDQLATVLADNIAEVMEKQTVRLVPASHKMTAAEVAGDVGGIFVPGLGLATGLAAGGVAKHLQTLNQQQSGRVSLFLLKDAGYDIGQAPLAWWLLASKKEKPLDKVALPARAANLYMALGTTWADAVPAVAQP